MIAAHSFAQTQTMVFRGGELAGGNNNDIAATTSTQMLGAAQQVMKGDYQSAERSYTEMIEAGQQDANIYIQRATIRRELQDQKGSLSDAQIAAQLASRDIAANPNNSSAYHMRSRALRLLGRFDEASRDLKHAMRLNGRKEWQNDFQAIEMERRLAKAIQ